MPKPTPISRRVCAVALLALAAAPFALAACAADEAPPPPSVVASAARDAALVAPTRVGVTRAQVSVDATGQAQVTVPLELPDAGNGLAPQLSLVYSSSVEAAGALGYGWALAPVSSVRRCPPSQALDGHDGGLTMSSEDRACLDGQRLVAIAGRDLDDGSSYRLERDDGTLARFARRGASDPGTWTVYRAGGEILRFGTDDASRLRHARGEAIEWKVAELRDRSDNLVRFEYAHDPDERDVRLSAIRYGGNDAAGVADYRRVDLVYASAGRPVSTYLAGHELVRDARLERVDVFTDGHPLGSYRLSYEATPSGTADLLRGVQRCFADGSCYPATRFDYSAGAPGLASEVRLGAAYRPDDPDLRMLTLRRLVDADGDGWDDVVSLNRDTIVVQRRTPTGFAEPEEAPSGLPITWSSRQNPALFYDLDADGRVDVLTTVTRTLAGRVDAAQTGIYALLGRAGGGFAPAVQVSSALGVGTEAQRLYLTMADADRDGRPDLFAFTDAGLRVLTWRDGHLVDAGASEIVLPQFGLSQGWRFDRHPREVADVNGDGFPDVVGFGDDAVHVSLGHGFRFDAPVAWTHEMTANAPGAPFGIENHLRQLADMNGDGLPDLVGFHRDGVLVALGTGESFAPATRWLDDLGTSQGWTSAAQLRTVTDVDGDGFADFVGISASRVRVILGRGTALPPVATLPRTQVVELATVSPGLKLWKRHLYPLDFADIDSDGQVDLLAFLPEGLFAARNTSARVRLTGVTDGYGRVNRIGYSSGNRTNVYRATAPSVYPLVTLPAVGLLVTSLEEQDGTAPVRRLTYAYADATVHRTGLGYLGFSTWTVRDEAAGTERVVHYSRDVARGTAGLPVLEETFAVEGSARRPLARTETTWESRALGGTRNVRRVLATRTRTVVLDAREVLVETVLDVDIDAAGNPVHQVTTITDATGTQSVTTDQTFGAEDPAAWIIGRVTASTVTFRRPGLPPVVQRATFAYDARGRLREDVREPGSAFETRRVQDRSGNPFGLVSTTTRHFSPSEAAGLPAAQAISSVRYDTRGYLAAAVNPLGHVQRVRERDPITQAVLASEDPNGLVTRYRYAADGALESVTAPDGTEARVERAFAAGDPDAPAGAVVRTTQHRTGQAPASSYTDASGRVLRRVTPQLGGQVVYQDSSYGFDGQVEAESLPYRRGEPVRWTRFGYDARRELVQVTHADGTVERRARAGLARSSTDALGRTATSIVDGQGLVREVIDAAGGVVRYEYDAANRLTAVVDPVGHRTEIGYDAVGRSIVVRDPSLGTTTTSYNALGLPVTVTDGAGYVRQNRYDLLGRLVESRAHAGLADEEVSRWSYDPAPGLLGQLASASGPAVTRRFGYDSLGRLATTDVDLDGRTYHLALAYDAAGRLARTTYPSGFTVEQVYDASGAFVEVRDAASGTSYYRVLEVYPWGAPARVRHGNGLVTHLDADPASAALRGVHTGAPGAADIVALAYEHDANGNVTARVDERTGVSERFGYDALDRLVSIERSGAAPVSVRYDALGNILERSDRGSYAYGEACAGVTPGPFAVTSVGERRYCYDARGRAVRAGARTLSYGAGDVPVAIHGPEASLELAYGPDGERVLETERRGAQVKRVRWPVPRFEEIDGPAGLEQRHYLAGGATVVVGPDGTREEYAHTDALGSVVAVTDESGAVRARYAFDAWGQRSASGVVVGDASRFGFTGQEELAAVGLVHMGGRVYDPEIGRFVAPDPFVQDPGDSQSLNRYSYVANNPLSATDPTGYFSVRSIGKSIGRALGGLGRGVSNPGASLARAGVRLNRWVQNPQNQRMVGSIAISVAAAYVAPLAAAQFQGFAQWAVGAAVSGAGGFASGYVASDGNLEYARRSGLSAMAFYGIGQHYMGKTLELQDMAVKAVAHGIVGGVTAAANGGSFESGFASSFLSEAVSLGDGYDRAARALEIDAGSAAWSAASSALVSGATSELTGGSFEQGAISGALGALYNRYFHRVLEKNGSVALELVHQQDGNPDEPCTLKYETVLKAVVIGEEGITYDPVAGFLMELPIVAVSAMAEGTGGLIALTGDAHAAGGMTRAASAAQGALLRAQLAAEEVAGARFPEAIMGYTRHGINQAISRDGVGVSTRAILDTFRNPLNITGQSGGRFLITGRNAVVILNAEGRVVTTWGTNAAGVRLVR